MGLCSHPFTELCCVSVTEVITTSPPSKLIVPFTDRVLATSPQPLEGTLELTTQEV